MEWIIVIVIIGAAMGYAHNQARRDVLRKLDEALFEAYRNYNIDDPAPQQRVGMLRYRQILVAQLHRRGLV